jgi:hypothetical protein
MCARARGNGRYTPPPITSREGVEGVSIFSDSSGVTHRSSVLRSRVGSAIPFPVLSIAWIVGGVHKVMVV